MFYRILAVGAHADDVELMAGGLLARFAPNVKVLCFCRGKGLQPTPESECQESARILGIRDYFSLDWYPAQRSHSGIVARRALLMKELETARDDFLPTCIITHASGDTHQDHAQVREEVLRVFRGPYTILGGVLPPNEGSPVDRRLFVRLSGDHVAKKIEACGAFRSQRLPHRRGFDPELIVSQARYWGLVSGVPLAEAFEVQRILV